MPTTSLRHGEPGDILVMAVPKGFLLGRMLPELGPGPWWEYIKTASDRHAAMEEARRLADKADVRAWLHHDGDEDVLIPSKKSKYARRNERCEHRHGRA